MAEVHMRENQRAAKLRRYEVAGFSSQKRKKKERKR